MRSEMRTALEPVGWSDEYRVPVINGFEEASKVLLGGAGWSNNTSSLGKNGMPSGLPRALVMMDPPDHTRVRSVLSPVFSARAIERLRPQVIATVNTVLDGLEDQNEADIVADFSRVVLVSVMAELFDIGPEDAEFMVRQLRPLLRWLEVGATPEDYQESADAAVKVTRFLTSLIDKRRLEPGSDLISDLLAVGDQLSTDDIHGICVLVIAPVLDATVNIVANSTLAILRDPPQIPHLLSDPGRAVEELLRMEGTSKQLIRAAVADHDLGGRRITKGQVVFIMVRDANRDPSRAPDADRLDLSRKPLGHLTFGNGPHYCLGAGFTRLVMTETLVRLFTRFPGLTLTSREPVWRPSTSFHGLLELPVRLRA